MSAKFTYLSDVEMNERYGAAAWSAPATIHCGIHIATTLSAAAGVGTGAISVVAPVTVGAQVKIDPLGGSPETFTIGGSTGAGPYTLTFSTGTTAGSFASGSYVSFEPGASGGNVLEPSGGGYARVSVTNNATQFPAASARNKNNANDIDFGTAATGGFGLCTHITTQDAATGGNKFEIAKLDTPRLVVAADTFKIPANQLDFDDTFSPGV